MDNGSHRQCTDTLQDLVEALGHVTCHLPVPPASLIKGSCPQVIFLNVIIEEVLTLVIELTVVEQSEIQSCETPVRVSLTTILEIVGQVLVPACPIEVGAKMSHAPSVVQGSTPRDHNLHRVEYSLMAVRDDTYFLITRQYPCSQDFEEPPPIFIVLRFNQSKRQRNQPVISSFAIATKIVPLYCPVKKVPSTEMTILQCSKALTHCSKAQKARPKYRTFLPSRSIVSRPKGSTT